ncbi:hypothetical protein JW758_04665 [Candidatus Peregrinibacteria bacterium]|nr:hypothetical protein [Candidatus Peregrinibacteria bacterium]
MFGKLKKISIAIIIFLPFSFLTCLSTQYYGAVKVDSQNLQKKIHKVAIIPPFIPEEIKNVRKDVSKTYEDLIISALKKGKIDSIPSEEYTKIWEPIKKNSGGLFDPLTGKVDENKMATLRQQAIEKMKNKFFIDGYVFINFTIASAIFEKSEASWDGVMDISTGYNSKFVYPNAHGRMPALSLLIIINDLDENILYRNAGGIHLLKYIHPAGYFVDVPIDDLFADKTKDIRAVNAAMKPFYKLFGLNVEQSTVPTAGTSN